MAQSADSVVSNIENLPGKYYSKVDKKINSINDLLSKHSSKYLAKFEKKDKKFRKKLRKLNPESLVAASDEKYDGFSKKRSQGEKFLNPPIGGEYSPYLDSLGTSLSFLKQISGSTDKVKQPLTDLHLLQSNLQQAEQVKAFISERKNQLREALSKYTKLPRGLKSQYDKLSKTAYYYSAQIQEYKEMLKDPKKIERRALTLLNKVPAFQKFMKENSQLVSLFRVPDNYGTAQNLTGLQTRSAVQSIIQQRVAAGGPGAQAQIQANLAAAQAELNKLKDKINQFGSAGGDVDMPNFKPNSQKTKSFLKRLEYSADVQFSKTNNLIPNAANIGLGIGYKLNDKSIIGFGLAYKMGMGTIQHINITHQGIGLRSYADYKIKGNFFINGGYEMNYNTAFKNIVQLKNYEAWQRSALVGVSKKYRVSKKVKGEIKLLYDFLSNDHIPVSQPFIFRTGYKL